MVLEPVSGIASTVSTDSAIYSFYNNPGTTTIALAGGQQYKKNTKSQSGSTTVPTVASLTSTGGQVTSCDCPSQYTEVTYRYTEDSANWKKGEVVKFCLFTPEETSN